MLPQLELGHLELSGALAWVERLDSGQPGRDLGQSGVQQRIRLFSQTSESRDIALGRISRVQQHPNRPCLRAGQKIVGEGRRVRLSQEVERQRIGLRKCRALFTSRGTRAAVLGPRTSAVEELTQVHLIDPDQRCQTLQVMRTLDGIGQVSDNRHSFVNRLPFARRSRKIVALAKPAEHEVYYSRRAAHQPLPLSRVLTNQVVGVQSVR